MHKTILLASALAAALIFVQPAAAQHRHGGHSHGGHSHGHSHGHFHGGFGHLGHHHHYHPSFGYGSYYTSPYYSYSAPTYYAYPSANYQYAPSAAPIVDPASGNQAQIQVILPNPEAEVTFDGAKTNSLGRVRSYYTPALDPSRTNSYRIGVTWMQDGRPVVDARLVTVTPGRTFVVDFTQPASESVPLRK